MGVKDINYRYTFQSFLIFFYVGKYTAVNKMIVTETLNDFLILKLWLNLDQT